MSKNEVKEQNHRAPVVTERTRKKHPGFVNQNKGIEVAPGLNLQDVPREMIQRHMRETEHFWKQKFSQKYGGSHGGQQSY